MQCLILALKPCSYQNQVEILNCSFSVLNSVSKLQEIKYNIKEEEVFLTIKRALFLHFSLKYSKIGDWDAKDSFGHPQPMLRKLSGSYEDVLHIGLKRIIEMLSKFFFFFLYYFLEKVIYIHSLHCGALKDYFKFNDIIKIIEEYNKIKNIIKLKICWKRTQPNFQQ